MGADAQLVSAQLLFRVATRPRRLAARPIQVAADIRASLYEFEPACRIVRLTPHSEGVTVELGPDGAQADAAALAAELSGRYPDVSFTIRWCEKGAN